MGLSDPLGGGHLEEVYLELRARTEKLKSDLQGATATVNSAMESVGSAANEANNPIMGIVNGVFSIGDAAEVAIGNMAVQAVAKLFSIVTQTVDAVASLAYNFLAGGVQINASLQGITVSLEQMFGSEQSAISFIQKLDDEAAAFGETDKALLLQTARSLLPYAQGDIQNFQKIVDLAKQLTVLHPQQGLSGAMQDVRSALVGRPLRLSTEYGFSSAEVKAMNDEFKKTGDVDAYVQKLSDLASKWGANADQVKAFGSTANANIGMVQNKIEELSRFAGAPIFAALQAHLGDFSKMFNANFKTMSELALGLGAVIAVLIDYSVQWLKDTFKNLTDLANTVKSVRDAIANALSDLAGLFVSFWAGVFHIKIDVNAFKKQVHDIVAGGLGDTQAALNDTGLFSDFNTRVKKYQDMFKDMIDTTDEGWNGINMADQQGQQQNVIDYQTYITKVIDIIDSSNTDLEKTQKDHATKMQQIDDNAAKAKVSAEEKYQQDLAKLQRDTQISIRDEKTNLQQQEEDQLKQHEDKLKQIQDNANAQLFDAVNARDARKVYDILNNAKTQTNAENVNFKNQLQQDKINYDHKIAQLKQSEIDKQKELQISLDQQLQQVDQNQADQRKAEEKSYQDRLQTLHDALKDKLIKLAQSWVDEGKMTKDGLVMVMRLLTSVYGPNGAYLNLMDGFNTALAGKAATSAAILKATAGVAGGVDSGGYQISAGQAEHNTQTGQSTTSAPPISAGQAEHNTQTALYKSMSDIPPMKLADYNSQYKDNPFYTGSFEQWLKDHHVIPAQFGFEGVVSEPTLFLAGEGRKPERVSISPQSIGNNFGKSSDKLDVSLSLDARGVSKDFEAMIATQVSGMISEAIVRKVSRRG